MSGSKACAWSGVGEWFESKVRSLFAREHISVLKFVDCYSLLAGWV